MEKLVKAGNSALQRTREWVMRRQEEGMAGDLLDDLLEASYYEEFEEEGGTKGAWFCIPQKIEELTQKARDQGFNWGNVVLGAVLKTGVGGDTTGISAGEALLGLEYLLKELGWEQAGSPKGGHEAILDELGHRAADSGLNFVHVSIVGQALREPREIGGPL